MKRYARIIVSVFMAMALIITTLPLGKTAVVYAEGDEREDITDYSKEQDRSLLPGWGGDVSRWYDVYVEDAEHPDGENLQYEVTNVDILSQESHTGNKTVLRIRKDTDAGDPENFWWHYDAESLGIAVLQVDYKNLSGETQSYTFKVTVAEEVYDLFMGPEDGSYKVLPGQSRTLAARVIHHSVEGDRPTDQVEIEWRLSGEAAEFAEIKKDENDPYKAVITFGTPEQESFWMPLIVEAIAYDGTEEGSGAPVERVRSTMRMDFASHYLEVWPLEIDQDFMVGSEKMIEPEIRSYPAENEQGYEVLSDVTWTARYNPDQLDITDDGDGKYSIKRLDNGEIWFDFIGTWQDENGEECEERQSYMLFGMFYDMWFDTDRDDVFTDGTLDLHLNTDMLGDYAADGLSIKYTVGTWDDKKEDWDRTFEEGNYYKVDGEIVTINGKAFADSSVRDLRVEAKLLTGDAELSQTDRWIHIREARIDYDREWNRDILPGWDGTINRWYHLYVENAEYPDGWDGQYEVLDVKLIGEECFEEGKSVIRDFEKQYENQDQSSENYWWWYRADGMGRAEFEVTYKDVDGEIKNYTFEVYVSGDVYNLDLFTDDGSDRGLPGST